jgi:hypothetical protein
MKDIQNVPNYHSLGHEEYEWGLIYDNTYNI